MENDSAKNEYLLKKEAKEKEKAVDARRKSFNKAVKSSTIIFAIIAPIVAFGWYLIKTTPSDYEQSGLSACVQHGVGGVHIHPELAIKIKGENTEIPANIGVSSACMRPIHTHDKIGVLHLEFKRPRDVKLGEFFTVWDKKFDSGCIFDYCNGPGGTVKILVNGKENFEFENYIMRDRDKIEIIYE